MHYLFDWDFFVGGVPVATFHGVARLAPRLADGTWFIAGIKLDGIRKGVAELDIDSDLYRRIALWLLTERYSDVEAEWKQHAARRRPVEAA